jgi:hypothetical protein
MVIRGRIPHNIPIFLTGAKEWDLVNIVAWDGAFPPKGCRTIRYTVSMVIYLLSFEGSRSEKRAFSDDADTAEEPHHSAQGI